MHFAPFKGHQTETDQLQAKTTCPSRLSSAPARRSLLPPLTRAGKRGPNQTKGVLPCGLPDSI